MPRLITINQFLGCLYSLEWTQMLLIVRIPYKSLLILSCIICLVVVFRYQATGHNAARTQYVYSYEYCSSVIRGLFDYQCKMVTRRDQIELLHSTAHPKNPRNELESGFRVNERGLGFHIPECTNDFHRLRTLFTLSALQCKSNLGYNSRAFSKKIELQ